MDQGKIFYRNTKGDGNIWVKNSGATSDFTFERSENDSVTFDHFTGVKIDGRETDSSGYTAESGSVIIKIKPEYLESLPLGSHEVTAIFDDGNSASARFTVIAAEDDKSDEGNNDTVDKKVQDITGKEKPETEYDSDDKDDLSPADVILRNEVTGNRDKSNKEAISLMDNKKILSRAPDTSDRNYTALWVTLLVLSAVTMAAGVYVLRRRRS